MTTSAEALALLRAGSWEDAALAAQSVLRCGPDAQALLVLARIADAHRTFAQAAELAQAACNAPGADALCHAQAAHQNMRIGDLEGARLAAGHVTASDTKDAEALDLAASVYYALADFTAAAALYRRAIDIDPTNTGLRTNLASSLTLCGDLDEARDAYRTVISADPLNARAFAALSEIRSASAEENNVDAIRQAIAQVATPRELLMLHHALAREHEALGEFRAALDALRHGKGVMLAGLGRPAHDDVALFQMLERIAEKPVGSAGHNDSRPIFIIGAPRSGTTLIERILSNSPGVVPLGESPVLPTLVKRATRGRGSHLVDGAALESAWKTCDFAAIGRAYCAHTVDRIDARRSVDKLPLNALLVDMILAALPDARIIRTDREPQDAVIGNYRQMFEFASGTYDYSLDLSATERFLNQLRRMLDRAEERHPQRILSIPLEDLVDDPQASAQRIYEFCDFPWNPAAIDMGKNQHPAGSASAAQVRQPINKSSDRTLLEYRMLLKSI